MNCNLISHYFPTKKARNHEERMTLIVDTTVLMGIPQRISRKRVGSRTQWSLSADSASVFRATFSLALIGHGALNLRSSWETPLEDIGDQTDWIEFPRENQSVSDHTTHRTHIQEWVDCLVVKRRKKHSRLLLQLLHQTMFQYVILCLVVPLLILLLLLHDPGD